MPAIVNMLNPVNRHTSARIVPDDPQAVERAVHHFASDQRVPAHLIESSVKPLQVSSPALA